MLAEPSTVASSRVRTWSLEGEESSAVVRGVMRGLGTLHRLLEVRPAPIEGMCGFIIAGTRAVSRFAPVIGERGSQRLGTVTGISAAVLGDVNARALIVAAR